MKVGNIVSNSKINVSEDFNVVKTVDKIIDGLPTLIVGWDYVHKTFPKYDITNKVIDKNLYWTFKLIEKRDQYESDMEWFISKAYSDFVSDISYVFVDPIQYDKTKLKKIVRKIKSLSNPIVYRYNKMVYIYGEKIIFGVDLSLLKYVGLNTEKIEKKIKNLSKTPIESSVITEKYSNQLKGLNNQIKYIPYFYFIDNFQ